jgi:RNA polymerase-binding transcription factor DksA
MTMDDSEVKAALECDRAETVSRREQLRRDLAEIIAAAADVATDDEHDPEGATIAYERSRTQSLIEHAGTHLSEIARTVERLEAGTYGVCTQCGGPIAAERLRARPVVQTCIACASA